MPLAMAAPDKREVEPVWTYRWEQMLALGVPVRTSMIVNTQAIRTYAPDFAIVATGALPRACPFDVTALDDSIAVLHAWDILREPARVTRAASFTIIGGGMVGIETADLLSQQGKRCTVIEALASLAPGMARNNRMELLDRLKSRDVRIMLASKVTQAGGKCLDVRTGEGSTQQIEVGDCLVIATGPAPVREAVAAIQAAGVAYALAGDCNEPGDFLSCLRDAWMVALSIDHRFEHTGATARN
jgi:pyruvate/2-oxoglutarate dehydrogenase complex dihydrolipoamide dehydrogenase (E3) component